MTDNEGRPVCNNVQIVWYMESWPPHKWWGELNFIHAGLGLLLNDRDSKEIFASTLVKEAKKIGS
eukprot:10012709-Ditylum_brightwellii.AAC.1